MVIRSGELGGVACGTTGGPIIRGGLPFSNSTRRPGGLRKGSVTGRELGRVMLRTADRAIPPSRRIGRGVVLFAWAWGDVSICMAVIISSPIKLTGCTSGAFICISCKTRISQIRRSPFSQIPYHFHRDAKPSIGPIIVRPALPIILYSCV